MFDKALFFWGNEEYALGVVGKDTIVHKICFARKHQMISAEKYDIIQMSQYRNCLHRDVCKVEYNLRFTGETIWF